MVQAELFSGLKAHKGVSRPTLKIKCYWLQSEAVTFHWDGIYYSEEEGTKYYAVCLQGQKKHPLLIKTLFWDGGFDFNWWVIPVFFFFFLNQLAKKWGFLKSISWSKIFHYLGFFRLTERHPEWLFPQAKSCLSLHERYCGTKFVTIKFQAHQEKATLTQYLWSRSEKWPRNRKYILKPTFQ